MCNRFTGEGDRLSAMLGPTSRKAYLTLKGTMQNLKQYRCEYCIEGKIQAMVLALLARGLNIYLVCVSILTIVDLVLNR